jgi:hypothetical protein
VVLNAQRRLCPLEGWEYCGRGQAVWGEPGWLFASACDAAGELHAQDLQQVVSVAPSGSARSMARKTSLRTRHSQSAQSLCTQ